MLKRFTVTAFSLIAIALSPALAEDKQTPLGKHMEEINSAYKKLRRADDPQVGAELARLGQTELIKALAYEPMMFAGVKDEKVKAAMAADYRLKMGQNYILFCQIELAALKGDFEKVKELCLEMRALKKKAHKLYIEED